MNPGSQTQTGPSEEDTRSKDPGTTTRSIYSAPTCCWITPFSNRV